MGLMMETVAAPAALRGAVEESYDNYDEEDESVEDSVPFPNAESSYEEILEFLQKTGGLGTPPSMDTGGGGAGIGATPGRIYGDDPRLNTPRLATLRAQKADLVQGDSPYAEGLMRMEGTGASK